MQYSIGPELPPETLALRSVLPLKPVPVKLAGTRVRLRPLDLASDVPPLFERTNGQPCRMGDRTVAAYDADTLVWRYLFGGPFASIEEMAVFLRGQVEAPNALCMCVLDAADGMPVGVASFMNNSPADLKIELGGIFYSPLVQRTGANTEATYLMLRHAFALGYRRLEWKCNSLNERSRRAALGMGFTYEGTQQAHMIVKGRNRDSDWFRILDHEWPDVRARLEEKLGQTPPPIPPRNGEGSHR